MQKIRAAASGATIGRALPWALALSAALACPAAGAASVGHSRLVSAPGQPLRIDVPLRQLDAEDLRSLSVAVAPADAWRQAGLTPPVELSTLRLGLAKGFSADSRVVQVRSAQPFQGAVADLLLELRSAAGSQLHQVSVLASGGPGVSAAAASSDRPSAGGAAARSSAPGAAAQQRPLRVRRGDTLFAIARRHAVQGVSVYQMMIALQRANPQAFIDGNINLLKAGATLDIPGPAALTEVSDREARRLFQQQAQAFATYRQEAARRASTARGGPSDRGQVSRGGQGAEGSPQAGGDQVVLSSGSDKPGEASADDRLADERNISESQRRVSQLEQNVHSLNAALQSQGEAAKNAVVDGAATIGQTLSDAASAVSSDSPADTASADGASVQGSGAGDTGASAAGGQGEAVAGGASDAVAATPAESDSSKAEQPVSWFQEHLLGTITAVLAIIVLIIAWLLRRANTARHDDQGAPVTEAMVQQQLEKINLDLSQPPSGEPARRS